MSTLTSCHELPGSSAAASVPPSRYLRDLLKRRDMLGSSNFRGAFGDRGLGELLREGDPQVGTVQLTYESFDGLFRLSFIAWTLA